MERLLTQKTLWENFSPSAEPLDVNVVRETVENGIVTQSLYFTGRTFSSGAQTRVFATVCRKTTKGRKPAVLVIGDYKKPLDVSVLNSLAKQGFVAMSIDFAGRCEKGLHTLYCSEVNYCNAENAPSMYTVTNTARETKLYEYSLNCMRAVTYLSETENASQISVLAQGNGTYVGIIVLGVDKRLVNGVVMFGSLHSSFKKNGDVEKLDIDEDELNVRLEMSEERQRYAQALSPQAYLMQIDVPLYIINTINSFRADAMDLDKLKSRINEKSRILVLADAIDCLPREYTSCVINWLKGAVTQTNAKISSFYDENGDYCLKIQTEESLENVNLWYCTDFSTRAKFWTKARLQKADDGYFCKLDLYESKCKLVAFAVLNGEVAVSSLLFREDVTVKNLKAPNNIIFSGKTGEQLLPMDMTGKWWDVDNSRKLVKGYLDIIGMKGKALATFALNDKSIRRNLSLTVSFDICCKTRQKLYITAVCGFGITNDMFRQSADLLGDGKWQRVTMEGEKFRRVSDNKSITEKDVVDLLIIHADDDFIVNNICII